MWVVQDTCWASHHLFWVFPAMSQLPSWQHRKLPLPFPMGTDMRQVPQLLKLLGDGLAFFSTSTNQQTNKLKARVSWCSRTSKPCVASQLAIKSPQTSTLNTFWKPPLLGVFFQIFQTFPLEKAPTTSGFDPIFSFDPNPKRSSLNQGLHRLVLQRGFFTSKKFNVSTLPIIFTHFLSSTEWNHHDHHTNSFKQTQTHKFSSQKINLKRNNGNSSRTSKNQQPVNQSTSKQNLSYFQNHQLNSSY